MAGADSSVSLGDNSQVSLSRNVQGDSYHLIVNLVTLGLSARIFRLTRSMIVRGGGSLFSSSESYSLLT